MRLGEIATVQTGPFGSQLHNKDYVIIGTPIVTVEHLGQKIMTRQNLPCVSFADKERLKKYTLHRGDLVFSRVGSVDRCSFVREEEDGWLFSGRCLRLRSKDDKLLDSNYLYYWFCLEETKITVRNLAVGSTMPSLNTTLLSNIEIDLPDIDTQRIIAATLSALDDKIALNTKINRNLEQMAQAIYKAWFVDFEPWGGVMPESWREGTISDLGDVMGGSTPSKSKSEYYTKCGIAWITPKDLSVNKCKFIAHGADDITELGLRNSSTKLMPRGTVLFSSRAPIGYIAIASGKVCTNQGFKSIVPKEDVGTAFIYCFLLENLQTIENMASGSTFKEISGTTMKGIPAIIPSKDILHHFKEKCKPIFQKQELLEIENACLATLRNTLLPRLMSGEIKIPLEV